MYTRLNTLFFALVLLLDIEHGLAFKLTSSAFDDGEPIPTEYLKADDNISPPLEFEDAPAGTKTFALIVDDADAPKGEGTHWIVYNIPEENAVMEEEISSGDGISKVSEVLTTKPPPSPPGQEGGPSGMPGMEGINMDMMGGAGGMMGGAGGAPEMPDSFYTIAAEGVTSDAQTSWSGPELSSSEKTLKFKAYALNEKMDLAPGASRAEVLAAMKGKVIGKTTLTGQVPTGEPVKKKAKKKKKKGKKGKKGKSK